MLAQAYAWALRRAFKFLLKRALGRFLRDDLDAEQLVDGWHALQPMDQNAAATEKDDDAEQGATQGSKLDADIAAVVAARL